jgi:hypothetical protein
MKKLQAEEESRGDGDGDGEENVPTSAQIEGLDGSDHERDSDSDEED